MIDPCRLMERAYPDVKTVHFRFARMAGGSSEELFCEDIVVKGEGRSLSIRSDYCGSIVSDVFDVPVLITHLREVSFVGSAVLPGWLRLITQFP